MPFFVLLAAICIFYRPLRISVFCKKKKKKKKKKIVADYERNAYTILFYSDTSSVLTMCFVGFFKLTLTNMPNLNKHEILYFVINFELW